MAEDSPQRTRQRIATFYCSLGGRAGVSVFWHNGSRQGGGNELNLDVR